MTAWMRAWMHTCMQRHSRHQVLVILHARSSDPQQWSMYRRSCGKADRRSHPPEPLINTSRLTVVSEPSPCMHLSPNRSKRRSIAYVCLQSEREWNTRSGHGCNAQEQCQPVHATQHTLSASRARALSTTQSEKILRIYPEKKTR
jgi:hypothetical protein